MDSCVDVAKAISSCSYAEEAANKAVKKTFAILGVNIENPKEVRDFQDSLRFSDKLRKTAEKGAVAFVIAVAGIAVAALWQGIKMQLGRQ